LAPRWAPSSGTLARLEWVLQFSEKRAEIFLFKKILNRENDLGTTRQGRILRICFRNVAMMSLSKLYSKQLMNILIWKFSKKTSELGEFFISGRGVAKRRRRKLFPDRLMIF
jgi:hypothetical protein